MRLKFFRVRWVRFVISSDPRRAYDALFQSTGSGDESSQDTISAKAVYSHSRFTYNRLAPFKSPFSSIKRSHVGQRRREFSPPMQTLTSN